MASKNASVPMAAWIAVAFFIVIVAVVVSYFVLYQPAQERLDRAMTAKEQAEFDLEELKIQEAVFDDVKAENDRLTKRLDDMKSTLPSSEDELNHFLASISQRARINHIVNMDLFKREKNIPREEVNVIPIRMEFKTTYDNVINFFMDLSNMGDDTYASNREQIVNIRNLELKRDYKTASNRGTLQVKCVAETYLYTGASASDIQKK